MPFSDHIAAVKKLQDDINPLILGLVDNLQFDVIQMQQQQLTDGKTSLGKSIVPKYTSNTVRRKKKAGLQYRYVDLYATGDFYEGYYLVFHKDSFTIENDDWKNQELTGKYKEIHGLTEENLQELIDLVRPLLQSNIIKRWQ